MEIADKIAEAIHEWESDWLKQAREYTHNAGEGYDSKKAFDSRMDSPVTWRQLLNFLRWLAHRLKG